MEPNITHLERIEIKNLWGEVDIDWQLDPKVNILIGINGSGKTTILELVDAIVQQKNLKTVFEFSQIKLGFNNNHIIYAEPIKDFEAFFNNSTRKRTAFKYCEVPNGYTSETNFIESSEKSRYRDFIHLDKVSTFDQSYEDKEEIENDGAFYENTDLDKTLRKLINDFKGYQLKLRNLEREETTLIDDKIRQLSLKDNTTVEELQALKQALHHKEAKVAEIYHQKNQFLFELNSLFEETHKVVDFDKNNALIFKKKGKTITPYRLSAGEKQILIILLKAVLQENQPSILLMDEPELSLHLAWQLKLIETIQRINENCQLIIATHAPGILNKGWRDKITKMENITLTKR
jgi:predicted ATPase